MAFLKSTKDIMLKRFFNGIIALFATSNVAAHSEPIKVLFIGNSYTHMNNMPKMFEKISKDAGMDVKVEMCAQSSATFKIHAEERPEVYKAIKGKKWDYVILQGFSRELVSEQNELDSIVIPHIDKLTKSIYQNNPCTNVMFYMTWGYKEGYGHLEETDSYEKMTTKIEGGYTYLSDYYNLPVVPVGLVWQEVRKNNADIDLYDADLAHPSKNGSYLAACTFFKAIFGVEVANNERIINRKFAEEISDGANRVLTETRDKYKLDRYFIDIERNSIENEQGNISYKLSYRVNTPKAKSVLVRLDGDKEIKGVIGMYEFSNPGPHNVKFEVTNNCDQLLTHTRKIDFAGIIPKRKEDE